MSPRVDKSNHLSQHLGCESRHLGWDDWILGSSFDRPMSEVFAELI